VKMPQRSIRTPKNIPAMMPPWGSPKHSSSARLLSYLRDSMVPVCRVAPHLTQVTAVSSFLVPHFVQ